MKIAIISDTHDNLTTLEKAVLLMNKNGIEEIIHCGDICSSYTLEQLAKKFPGKIHVVFGNVDGDVFSISQHKAMGDLPNVILYGEIGELELGGVKIAFAHSPKIAKALAASGKYNIVFYGHTHRPWEETINLTRLINPGNLSNLLYKASFAAYDFSTGKLELKTLAQL